LITLLKRSRDTIGPKMNRVECNYHPGAPLIEDHRAGDQICSECGLVVGDRVIDVSSEWRSFSNASGDGKEDRSRVGAAENTLLGSSDLTTLIGPATGRASFDGMGNALYNNNRRPGGSSVASSERALINAFRSLSNMADRINLPKTILDRASLLFKKVNDGGRLRGRPNEAVTAACLYISCRQEGVPRTFKEIVAVSTVNKRDIGRCFKIILKWHEDTKVGLVDSGDFMSRFCGLLGLSREIQRAATCIAKKTSDLELAEGRSPVSVTAAAIYMATQASHDPRVHAEISAITGVAESTLKQCYKLMLPRASKLFPENFAFVKPVDRLPHH